MLPETGISSGRVGLGSCSPLPLPEEILLAYLLYKYTLNRTFIIDIKVNNNFKISMNLSLAEKLPIFLCSTVILTVKTNEWTQIEL